MKPEPSPGSTRSFAPPKASNGSVERSTTSVCTVTTVGATRATASGDGGAAPSRQRALGGAAAGVRGRRGARGRTAQRRGVIVRALPACGAQRQKGESGRSHAHRLVRLRETCLLQSLRNWSTPRSVSGCTRSNRNTDGGTAAASAPMDAASVNCRGARIDAALSSHSTLMPVEELANVAKERRCRRRRCRRGVR